MVVVAICGLTVGWAPHGTVLETFGAFGLLLLFAFAVTWAGIFLGLSCATPTAPTASDDLHLPRDVPVRDLRPGRRAPHPAARDRRDQSAERAATAVRELFGVATGPLPDVWTLQHPVATSLAWAAGSWRSSSRLRSAATSGWVASYCAPRRSSRSAAASPR